MARFLKYSDPRFEYPIKYNNLWKIYKASEEFLNLMENKALVDIQLSSRYHLRVKYLS